jgi:hypothetical protein
MPHLVSDIEIGGKDLSRRAYDWSVMGASYESRVEARQLIDAAGLRRAGKYQPYIFSTANRVGLHLYNKFWAIEGMNFLFRHALRAAKYGFTCGGACHWPVRKYFEIPANGAVLAAERCSGFEALGFVDRKNALVVDPRDVLDASGWLDSNIDRAQTIANAGRDLVQTQHSVKARARQLADTLSRISTGSFNGAFWKHGLLTFQPRTDLIQSDKVAR